MGVPQRLALGPLFFKIVVKDICHLAKTTTICSCVNDTTIDTSSSAVNTIIDSLKADCNTCDMKCRKLHET